jgi:arylsulfatase A-like enzyme/Tfp pilus assembly protein PilF
LIVGITAIASCSPRSETRRPLSGSLSGWNVLLVTIDTLRADHVGAYGSRLGATPTLDRLAREGVRFERTYAHVPLTLPSHTTIMTGLYPMSNGVRDNGSFRFDGSKPTLAGTLKTAGYRTGAFVGSFVVDARFGLNKGFDVYDDNYGSRPAGGELSLLERPAEQVLAPARNWILTGGSTGLGVSVPSPWFAWIHLYDPHDPYNPPEPYRSRYAADLYAGETAYADASLGAALAALERAGSLARTLVVVASDHGESLGEHGERTHGLFAYDATLRVPLIIWAPPSIRPAVVRSLARLVDIAPTILDLVGVSRNGSVDGHSLWPFVSGERTEDDAASYFEALNANLTRNWAPLTGVVSRGRKLIDLPIPELYDLAADPGERHNVYARQPEQARPLERALDALTAGHRGATAAPVDSETSERLRSLGYLVAPVARPSRTYTAADDPKTLVGLQNRLDAALDRLKSGDVDEAERLLEGILSERPDFMTAYERLAFLYHETNRREQAIATLERASREGVADAELLSTLGGYLQEANRLDRSAAVLEAALKMNPSEIDAYEKLGITYTRMKRFREAERRFRYVLSIDPNSPLTYNNLGSMFLTEDRTSDAIEALTRAVALDPGLAAAHNGLGVAYARQGDKNRAVAEWREALRLRPELTDAADNLQRISTGR